MARIKPNYRE